MNPEPASRTGIHTGADTEAVAMYGPEFAADPGAVYGRLRALGPAAPVELAPGVRATLVTDYSAALQVLRNPATYSKDPRRWRALAEGRVPADSPVIPMMAQRPSCLYSDGPEHARLRQTITDSLARVDTHALRRDVERTADAMIDRFAPVGQVELLSEYARILPLRVLNRLFGLSAEQGERLIGATTRIMNGVDPERTLVEYVSYIRDLVTAKRARPGHDVASWLMAHEARLSDEEMMHQLVVLIGAGNEPTSNLIGNALRLLLSDDRFAGDLAGGAMTITDALDEVLWTDPPMANLGVHYPVHDVDLAGVRLREGEPVLVSFSAANTDPALPSDQRRSGNRAHLAYSAGPHRCPARDRASLIASVAIEKLLDRLPDIELSVPADQLEWRPGPFHRALAALPARFTPAPVEPAGPVAGAPPAATPPAAIPAAVAVPAAPPPDAGPAAQAPPARRSAWARLRGRRTAGDGRR